MQVTSCGYREEDARYSRRVGMAEIEKNEFNHNISHYISTAVGEAVIDLQATHDELVEIEKIIAAAKKAQRIFERAELEPAAIGRSPLASAARAVPGAVSG